MADETVHPVTPVEKRKRFQSLKAFLSNGKARVGLVIFVFFLLTAIFAPVVSPYDPNDTNFAQLAAPSARHWLGTTGNGQDVLSQLIWGARTSLTVGILAGVLSTAVAVLIGMYPGYRGGWIDNVLDTVTNIFMVIPSMPLIIVIASYIHSSGPYELVFVIGLTGWAGGARVLRSQALTYRNRDFVVAAKLSGASELGILFGEILPNMLSLIIHVLMGGIIGGIMSEAFLEFLGLGNSSVISWGTMMYWADTGGAMLMGAWWWLLPGGLAIAVVGMSMALMNYGIDQVTNPRLNTASKKKTRKSPKPGGVEIVKP